MGKGIDKWEDRRDIVFSYICLIEMIEKWIQNKLFKKKKKSGKRNLEPSEIQETEKSKDKKDQKNLLVGGEWQFYQNHTFLFLLLFSSYLILGDQVLVVPKRK